MISALELFGNVTVIILLAVAKGTSLLSLIHGMILYAVLIPRTFLMNTSHNKNRIVDKGWKNIIKNLTGKTSNRIQDSTTPHSSGFDHCKKSEQKKCAVKDMKIFTLEGAVDKDSKYSNKMLLKEGTSHGIVQSGNNKPQMNYDNLDVEDFEEEDDENEIINKLLLRMLSEITNEILYMSSFKKLITYIDYKQKGKVINNDDLEYEFSSDFNQTENTPIETLNRKKSLEFTTCQTYLEINPKEFDLNKRSCCENCYDKDKVTRRTNLLSKIFISLDKKQNYDILIEQLIDLEESFIRG